MELNDSTIFSTNFVFGLAFVVVAVFVVVVAVIDNYKTLKPVISKIFGSLWVLTNRTSTSRCSRSC